MVKKRSRFYSISLGLGAMIVLALATIPSTEAFDEARISLVVKQQQHALFVQFAHTYAQRKQGLMHRENLAPYDGMLFDFEETRMASMWMKNTPLPLDMIFFDAKRDAVHVHYGATPFSENVISSQLPSRYVLEIPAGMARQYGVLPGDRFEWSAP